MARDFGGGFVPDPAEVKSLFARIAPCYDLLNHLFSARRDLFWRRSAARAVKPVVEGPILDLACGTLDQTVALARAYPLRPVIGVDFSLPMIRRGRPKLSRLNSHGVGLAVGDGLHLPFAGQAFAAATISFGIRNLPDRGLALAELCRVLKPGGRLAVLELGLPVGPIAGIYLFYLKKLLPRLARPISGRGADYDYLVRSILEFPRPAQFLKMMARAGFSAQALPLTQGICWLFVGQKG